MKASFPQAEYRRRRGMALVIVLAFMVLLTGLVVAYLARSVNTQKVATNSSHQTRADILARSALDIIIGDLKQEIVDGSTESTVGPESAPSTLYVPLTAVDAVPKRSGNPPVTTPEDGGAPVDPIPNLIRRSVRDDTLAIRSRASAINSADDPAADGRRVSPARWNSHYLIPRFDAGDAIDSTPDADANFEAPDWVLLTRGGPAVHTSIGSGASALNNADKDNANFVIGRYAYAIYDEGGLLDLNAAGYPEGLATNLKSRKVNLALADLTRIPIDKTGANFLNQTQINQLVGWRNYASAQPQGSFGNFAFNADRANLWYKNFVDENQTGFLETVRPDDAAPPLTDQAFLSRQQLIKMHHSLGISQNALQYFTHYSRALDQPSYVHAVQTSTAAPVVLAANLGGNNAVGGDKLINPNFPAVRVQDSFTRNDGTTASAGEPLVNKRFALNRLAWITYQGPSSSRNTSATDTTGNDGDIGVLKQNGITKEWLDKGTASNIEKYFGLAWDAAKHRWTYDIHRGRSSSGSRIIRLIGRPSGTAEDANVYVQDSGREPNFFELLKAGIAVGSLGKAATPSANSVNAALPGGNAVPPGYIRAQVPANFRYNFDTSVDYHVIQIGANILSAVNPTSYPVRIAFDDGSARGLWEFQGVTDLPYLSYVFNGVLRTKEAIPAPDYGNVADSSPLQYPRPTTGTPEEPAPLTDSGEAYAIQVPTVWNPYDPNGTQGVLRPSKFRVVIDSNDPVSLANGSPNQYVWCATQASTRTAGTSGGNQGLGHSPGAFSYDATTNPTSKTGSQVSDAVTFNDNNGSLYREPTLIFRTSVGNASRTAGNIRSIDDNPLPGGTDPKNTPFAPLVLGNFPLAFQHGTNVLHAGTAVIGHGLTSQAGNNRVYFTYRLQYEYPAGSNTWVTYDTKYGRTTHGQFSYQCRGGFSPCVIKGPNHFNPMSWAGAIDPRTSRFGLFLSVINYGRSKLWSSAPPPDNGGANGWVFDSSGNAAIPQGITYPIRPDYSAGFYFTNTDRGDLPPGGRANGAGFSMLDGLWAQDTPYPSFAAGWTRPLIHANEGHGPVDVSIFTAGMYAQNNPSVPFYVGRYAGDGSVTDATEGPVGPAYYADADGVVRRAAGAYVPVGNNTSGKSPVGLPTTGIQGYPTKPASLVTPATKGAATNPTPLAASQSRPLLLHRPFRTVAELGYVFRDLPWKNLDFFTPESGDAALLDLFCINETTDSSALVAGKVNLNTRQAPVLEAVVAGAYVDDPKISNTTVGSLSPSLANSISAALTARTADTSDTYGPLQNIAELIGKWNEARAISRPSGITYKPVVSGANSGVDLPLSSGYKDGKLSYTGFSGNADDASGKDLSAVFTPATSGSLHESLAYVKRLREAPVRALANAGQTRVWNLMIDVVAQSGRYPKSATTLDRFLAEGEQRYWVHVSIDRLTGQVIDKQVEIVKE